jgi:hypothetical protein
MTIKYNEPTKCWELGNIAVGQLIVIVKGAALLASRKDCPYNEAKEVDKFFAENLYNALMKKSCRRHFKIRAKVRTTGQVVTPEYSGYKTRGEIIEFFGLEESDIEWYEITEEPCDKNNTTPNDSNG